eukprot:m.239060 g.239060  ORF g.239060 m.239060 type:complete len:426 (-) comp18975_c0_seq6:50-1327(-)
MSRPLRREWSTGSLIDVPAWRRTEPVWRGQAGDQPPSTSAPIPELLPATLPAAVLTGTATALPHDIEKYRFGLGSPRISTTKHSKTWTSWLCDGASCFRGRSALPLLTWLGIVLLLAGMTGTMSTTYYGQSKLHQHSQANRYAVVIDAGSSGSRVFVYTWPCGTRPDKLPRIAQLQNEIGHVVVKKIEPGLSYYADKPRMAVESVLPLLQYAALHIPASNRATTPLYILATAGLRSIPPAQSKAILQALRQDLPTQCEFRVLPGQVDLISGEMEGVYQWVSANYVLGRLEHPTTATVGAMDMGGGSAQIAFELVDNVAATRVPEALKTTLDFGLKLPSGRPKVYTVYVATHLGFGANHARQRYVKQLQTSAKTAVGSVKDPCLTLGQEDIWALRDADGPLVRDGGGDGESRPKDRVRKHACLCLL